MKRQSGFTLIELTIVLVLISLFSALTLPLLTGLGQDGLEASARRLTGTAKQLYNESALSGLEYRLIFNLDEGSFRAQKLERRQEGAVTVVEAVDAGRPQQLRGESRFGQINIPGRGIFTSGEVTTTIHPSGWIEETVIHLENEKRSLTLRVNPFTGSTEIYEGFREFQSAGSR